MNTKSVTAMGLLLAVFGITATGAQQDLERRASPPAKTAEHPLDLCTVDEKTDATELKALQTYSSPALEKAMLSSKSFWDFVSDPSTPYMDRMAAANRGGSMLSPEELPWLWQAMAEVGSVPSGVSPPPCSAIAGGLWNSLRENASRVILGREIQLPTNDVGFPVTAEERNRSPWLWQMERALSTLFDRTNNYYGDPGIYPARVRAAWAWPIPTSTDRAGGIGRNSDMEVWNRTSIRTRALTEIAPHDTLLLQTILKLALSSENQYVAYSAPVHDLYAWGDDSFHYEELAHVAQIVILQRTRREEVAAQAAFVAASLAQYKVISGAPRVRPLKTATGALAIGRWAMSESLNPWNRYYSFVEPICRMVDDPPCPVDQLRDPNDPRLDKSLKTFEAWFEKEKPKLESEAEAERPHLESLAKELQIDIE